jgi:metal-responsive CopG/Arc/MetJ family transcriptional regulator
MRITVSLPDELARRFMAAVPDRKRSSLVARLLEDELRKHEKALERACRAANDDAALTVEVDQWQAFEDPLPKVAER